MEKSKIKEIYTEILDVVSKYSELGKDYAHNGIENMIAQAKKQLWCVELYEKYGLDINPERIGTGVDYIKIDDYQMLTFFGETRRRTISWSDNDKQPEEGEFLLYISFPTGAYIFGDDYPKELFQEFWQELKSYEPKYCDTANYNLYFSMDNASKIYNNFRLILDKYRVKNKEQAKDRKIKKLKDELDLLQATNQSNEQ